MSAVTSSSDSDGESTESPVVDDSQLVTSSSNSNSNISSFLSSPSNSSSISTAASCSCTSFLFHSLLCPVPISRRVSLYFTSPSSALPRNQYSFNIEYFMSQRVASLSNASNAQKQLINVGINMSRATCSLKPDVWSSLLVDYVPSDSCYTS